MKQENICIDDDDGYEDDNDDNYDNDDDIDYGYYVTPISIG